MCQDSKRRKVKLSQATHERFQLPGIECMPSAVRATLSAHLFQSTHDLVRQFAIIIPDSQVEGLGSRRLSDLSRATQLLGGRVSLSPEPMSLPLWQRLLFLIACLLPISIFFLSHRTFFFLTVNVSSYTTRFFNLLCSQSWPLRYKFLGWTSIRVL